MRQVKTSRSLTWSGFAAALLAVALPLMAGAAPADIDDADIASAVETDLLISREVPSHRVNVAVQDGIVTLTGSIDTILGRDRAVEIAQAVKGVRSVVNRLKVEPVDRTDVEIRSDIVAALAVDPSTESYELDVAVQDGTVTLSGTVESYKERELCATVTKGVKGVREIDNEIKVRYESDRTDGEIKAEIERLLANDVRIDAYLVDVAVKDGDVTLSGTVGSATERTLAQSTAWVAGVKNVDTDDLTVEWWARDRMQRKAVTENRLDADIEQAVEDAMAVDPRVWSFEVGVDSSYGTVTLTGEVGNLRAKQAAAQDARNTIGVWRVKNHIKVRPVDPITDSEIVEDVEAALTRDPYVDRYETTVSARNGKVYLYGNVDSAFEKRRASEVAWGVTGVIDVENNMNVGDTWPWKSDWKIAEDIRDQIYWNPYLYTGDITVRVRDGVATLTGEAPSWYARSQAEQSALDAGAKSVRNQIHVENGPPAYMY